MAEANTKQKELYLEENVKKMKGLPNDIIRLCNSYQQLNKDFEQNFKMAQQSFNAFQTQSVMNNNNNNNNNNEWTKKDDLCAANLKQMRKCEENMMMFQDEKIALLQENIHSLESYINKISKDLDEFQKILQPNMIKLPFPKKTN